MVYPVSTYSPWLSDDDFQSVYRAMRKNTLVDEWRCWELWSLLGELREIPGGVIEVGVWRGGTGALMAARCQELGIDDPIFLCDTWTGHRQDERRRHLLPRRQARRHVEGDRRGARAPARRCRTASSCCRASSPRTPASRPRATSSGSCTSTSTSTSRAWTSSSGPGRACRRAAPSCSTTTAARPRPGVTKFVDGLNGMQDRIARPQPQRARDPLQALRNASVSASASGVPIS